MNDRLRVMPGGLRGVFGQHSFNLHLIPSPRAWPADASAAAASRHLVLLNRTCQTFCAVLKKRHPATGNAHVEWQTNRGGHAGLQRGGHLTADLRRHLEATPPSKFVLDSSL